MAYRCSLNSLFRFSSAVVCYRGVDKYIPNKGRFINERKKCQLSMEKTGVDEENVFDVWNDHVYKQSMNASLSLITQFDAITRGRLICPDQIYAGIQ